MIAQSELEKLYNLRRLSVKQIASELGCSNNKVIYWMDRYAIPRRTISDAIYQKHNPTGDPFKIKTELSLSETKLLGLGLGLYWGEGNKANKHSVRLGNTDPELINTFIEFLVQLFGVNKTRLKFGLQLFSDTAPDAALKFWLQKLDVKPIQFYKITITPSNSIGTYRHKNQNGVLTVYFHNKKLRDIIVGMLPR